MIEIISRTIKEGRVVSLINRYLKAGAIVNKRFEEMNFGLAQGGHKITGESGFENAVNTVTQALSYGAADPDSLLMVHTRLNTPRLHLKPIKVPVSMPELTR